MDGSSPVRVGFPLAMAAEGERVCIVSCGERKGVARQLSELGLPIGTQITVVRRHAGGPMVVARDGLRIALGAGIAHRVLVTHRPDERA